MWLEMKVIEQIVRTSWKSFLMGKACSKRPILKRWSKIEEDKMMDSRCLGLFLIVYVPLYSGWKWTARQTSHAVSSYAELRKKRVTSGFWWWGLKMYVLDMFVIKLTIKIKHHYNCSLYPRTILRSRMIIPYIDI